MFDHQSGSCNSGESYREGFIQLKWKLMGCSFEQPFLYGGFYGAEASKLIYRELNLRVNPTLKQDAESVLGRLGIPMSTAVDMFLNQIVLVGGSKHGRQYIH